MKKFSNVTSAAASNPRTAARIVLAFVASILVVLLAMMGMASGPNGALLFAQESPSPTAQPSGPAIAFLNPAASYDPGYARPPRPPEAADRPKVSDRFDGVDEAYHITAAVRQAPANAVVEAYIQYGTNNELTIGVLDRVEGSDTWELFWEIPESLADGNATMKVRLYAQTASGFEQVATDEVLVDMQHRDPPAPPTPSTDTQPADETVEITWPLNAGRLGFFKARGGTWQTVIDGYASSRSEQAHIYYTVSPPGTVPEYKECGFAPLYGTPEYDSSPSQEIPFQANCALLGEDTPSKVTAVAIVVAEMDDPDRSESVTGNELTQDSGDAHRVTPYIQDPSRMKADLQPDPGNTRRRTTGGCLAYLVTVTDELDRPVNGANVDVHLEGPGDQVRFATVTSGSSSGGNKPPDKGGHSQESGATCTGGNSGLQGEHNVPGGADVKHRESATGTGPGGGSGGSGRPPLAGQWRFHIYSGDAGISRMTAWVDSPAAPASGQPEVDDDLRSAGEASATDFAQWLPAPMTLTIAPRADSATVGSCNRYTARLRAGDAVVRDYNIDVHASGPNNDLDFCDPGDGTPRSAPEHPEGDNAHAPEDQGEAWHESDSPDDPQVQHTEGQTDSNGNFIFGITSAAIGSTEITAWGDGEKERNNDVQDSGEPSGTATKNWAGSAQDAEVRFVNPSGYGGSGDNLSLKRDADELVHLVARVDLPDVVEGVEFFRMDGETMVQDLGDATRVGTTDTWELFTVLPEGSYTLRAQIINTNKREDRAVTLDNTLETAELTLPANGTGAPFSEGETEVRGVASAAAEGVEFYYTKTDAREVRNAAQWIHCGETELPTGDAPQNFQGKCALQGTDAALQVTGIAALTWTCDPILGCEVERTYQTGDAHRVFGFEANPSVTIEPAEASGSTGTCKRFELTVSDAAGRAIPNANVDVHLTGPTDGAFFCEVSDSSPRRAPTSGQHAASPRDGEAGVHQNSGADTHHTEGQSNEGGKFIFGVRSGSTGDSRIVGWADQNDNDELDNDEKSDESVMHWGGGGGGGGNRTCTIRGNGDNNTLVGTPGDDVICAGRGKDVIRGKGGDDVIRGGRGNDDIRGNVGRDTLIGGRGIDALRGGRGADVARGHSGDDTLRGFTGSDTLSGGDDNDVISGGDHNDRLRGNRGRDLLSGGGGRDNCGGGRGRDSITRCE